MLLIVIVNFQGSIKFSNFQFPRLVGSVWSNQSVTVVFCDAAQRMAVEVAASYGTSSDETRGPKQSVLTKTNRVK
jgi:hypothetical protein